jgi:hypothetical protein
VTNGNGQNGKRNGKYGQPDYEGSSQADLREGRFDPGTPTGEWMWWYDLFISRMRVCGDAIAVIKGFPGSPGLHRVKAYDHRNACPKFEQAWDEAREQAFKNLPELLEESAMARAIFGWPEPIYYKGECIGHRQRYSDALTIFMLKSWKPDRYLVSDVAGAAGTYEDAAQAILDARNKIIETMGSHSDNRMN